MNPSESFSFVIRPATMQDACGWIDLLNALTDYEKLDRPDSDAVVRLINDAFGDTPRFTTWLAVSGDEPIGYCVFFETYSTILARPTLFLEDLFVREDYRGKGVGKGIWNQLEQEVVRRGCGRMEWACLAWNKLGIDFYEQRGAQAMTTWIHYRLLGTQIADRSGD